MTLYYVRTGVGSDAAAGTSPATAWATISKALSAAAGPTGGDTIYVSPGAYRETVTANLTAPTSTLSIVGDVDGSHTGDAPGEVVWTAYTTNDTTAPAAAATLTTNGRHFLSFSTITFVGGAVDPSVVNGAVYSHDITFTDCVFVAGGNGNLTRAQGASSLATAWTFDRCVFLQTRGSSSSGYCLYATNVLATGATDFNVGIAFKNCLFLLCNGGGTVYCDVGGGTGPGKPGGVALVNCTLLGGGDAVHIELANHATSTGNQHTVYGCLILGASVGIASGGAGQVLEDQNVIVAVTARTNVTAGANSFADYAHALLFQLGQEVAQGKAPRPFLTPARGSGFLNFGNATGATAYDVLNRPRPAGGALNAVGYLERHDTGAREITTVRTGATSLKLAGPADHDFVLPVDATATTLTVYAQYDANYGAGTKPQLAVRNGTECGVADATATMTAVGAGVWQQLQLTFTPTARGIVTVRLISGAAAAGACYWDDVAIA